jgi:hypothetical protein
MKSQKENNNHEMKNSKLTTKFVFFFNNITTEFFIS